IRSGAPAPVPAPSKWPGTAPELRQRIEKIMRLTPIKKTFTYGAHQVTLETGEMARQAHGAVVVNMDDTVVLCTVVGAKQAKAGQDFLPPTCDYVEKTSAAGKSPGGLSQRE